MTKMRAFFWLVFLLGHVTSAYAVSLPDFSALVEKYSPAVVNISTTQKIDGSNNYHFRIPGLPDNHGFREFFKKFFEHQQQFDSPDSFDEQSLGSGFIVSRDGYILTNAHVVADADEILVRLYDRRELLAEVVGVDEQTDIALLKIDAENLPTVKLGSSRDLKVGEWVMAIGNPFGFDHTVTAGIVSAKGRSFRDENYVPFLQTDVAINPGNSGGPLFNVRGEVVGVNSRISSEPGRRSYAGLSFAIPAEVARDAMQQLKAHGFVSRGWLGVMIQDVTLELSKSFAMDKPKGALVAKVIEDSPAQHGGVNVGDIILKLHGHQINTSSELPPLVGVLRAGKMVDLEVIRDGKRRTLHVKIGKLPEDTSAGRTRTRHKYLAKIDRLGIELRELDEVAKKENGTDYGVLVTGILDTAGKTGLRQGDVIQMVDNQKVKNIAHLKKIVSGLNSGRSIAVLIYRNAEPIFLAMRMP